MFIVVKDTGQQDDGKTLRRSSDPLRFLLKCRKSKAISSIGNEILFGNAREEVDGDNGDGGSVPIFPNMCGPSLTWTVMVT